MRCKTNGWHHRPTYEYFQSCYLCRWFLWSYQLLDYEQARDKNATLDHNSVDSPASRLVGGPIQENPEKVATASPITYISWDDPPFLIVHSTPDPLVSFNQSELLHGVLTSDGITSTLLTVRDGGHGRDIHTGSSVLRSLLER